MHQSAPATPAVGPRRTSGRSILAALFWLLSCLAILAGIVVSLLAGRGEAEVSASEAEGG